MVKRWEEEVMLLKIQTQRSGEMVLHERGVQANPLRLSTAVNLKTLHWYIKDGMSPASVF